MTGTFSFVFVALRQYISQEEALTSSPSSGPAYTQAVHAIRSRLSVMTEGLTGNTGPGWMVAAVGLVAVFVALNMRLLIGLDAALWDADRQFAPAYGLVADHARAGRILLWNPWIAGGYPEGVDPQIGTFSPLTVGFGLLAGGSERGFRFYWLTTWLLGGFGTLLLARHLRAPSQPIGMCCSTRTHRRRSRCRPRAAARPPAPSRNRRCCSEPCRRRCRRRSGSWFWAARCP